MTTLRIMLRYNRMEISYTKLLFYHVCYRLPLLLRSDHVALLVRAA